MKGASQFIEKNLKSTNTIFELCMQSIVYSYLQLVNAKVYSRKSILAQTTKIRGKKARVLELEDYLRNDLVRNFIEPNLVLFNLQNYLFISGAEEMSSNIKTGVLDIKVCSPSFSGNVYYIFECKRLNKALIRGYLNEGVFRFINGKYYPETNTPLAGLISFLESDSSSSRIDIKDSLTVLNSAFQKRRKQLRLLSGLDAHTFKNSKYSEIKTYKYAYHSSHSRIKSRGNISLYHLILDYNSIVTD